MLRRHSKGGLVLPLNPIGLFKRLLLLLVVLYIAVTIIHLANGLAFGSALTGSFIDARIAVACPQKGKLLWNIINRNELLDFAMRASSKFGGNYADLCQLESDDELFNSGFNS